MFGLKWKRFYRHVRSNGNFLSDAELDLVLELIKMMKISSKEALLKVVWTGAKNLLRKGLPMFESAEKHRVLYKKLREKLPEM